MATFDLALVEAAVVKLRALLERHEIVPDSMFVAVREGELTVAAVAGGKIYASGVAARELKD